MEKPVKPKRPTSAEVGKAMMRRKNILVTHYENIKTGAFSDLTKQAEAFAEKNDVPLADVKVQYRWGNPSLSVRRRETDVEKEKRVRRNLNSDYQVKVWEYERALRRWEASQYVAKWPGHCPRDCACRA